MTQTTEKDISNKDLALTMTDGFKFMRAGFKRMDQNFKKVDERLDNLRLITSQEFDKVRSEMSSVERRLENKIEGESEDIRRDIGVVRSELKIDMAQIDKRLSKLEVHPVLQDEIS